MIIPNIGFVGCFHDFHHEVPSANDPDSDTRPDGHDQSDPVEAVEALDLPAVILPVREVQLCGSTEFCWVVQC